MNEVQGNFTYPPSNSNLQFDYRDSVVTSWVTDDSYATEGVLSLWYWLLSGQANWTMSVIEAVPANGSKSVALEVGVTSDFLGQFNINYNSNDGSQQKYDSPMFQVIHHTGEISPVTWNQQALSTTSLRFLSSSIPQATSAITSASTSTGASKTTDPSTRLGAASTDSSMTTSAMTSTLTSTKVSKTDNPNLHSAVAIGLGVGITFGIAAMGLIGFLYWKKKKKNLDRTGSLGMPQKPPIFMKEENMVGELDAHQRHLELPVDRLDAELDESRPRL